MAASTFSAFLICDLVLLGASSGLKSLLGRFDADYVRNTSKAYFQLRRALEHHNDVPESDLVVPALRIGLLAGDQEVKVLGVALPKGTGLSVKTFDADLKLAKGQNITLTPQDAYNLVFTMRMILAPEIFRSHVETP